MLPLSPVWAQEAAPRVERYSIDARFIPDSAYMEGTARIFFAAGAVMPTKLTCYLHGELRVDSVMIAETSVPVEEQQVYYEFDYSLVADEVRFPSAGYDPGRGVTIFYSGYFHPSQARSPSDYMRIDADGVFLRSYAYSLWFPVFLPARQDDYAATFSPVAIRTPTDYQSVFVGEKTADSVAGGVRITRWEAIGVPLHAAQCTAQRYLTSSEGNCHLYYYRDSLSQAAAAEIRDFAREITTLYNRSYRRSVAGGSLHLMEMPRFGDISSGNVTGLTYWIWQQFANDVNAKRAFGHELVHPYVAVPVERADSLYALAIEAFPSYFHLPIMAELLGEEWYDGFIGWMEKLYLDKRAKGTDRRGNPLPPEKPLLAITAEEMSTYKDEFVLDDRALLFLNFLRREMGHERFFDFARELFNRDRLTSGSFRQTILTYLPDAAKDVDVWLATTEFPERFRINSDKTKR